MANFYLQATYNGYIGPTLWVASSQFSAWLSQDQNDRLYFYESENRLMAPGSQWGNIVNDRFLSNTNNDAGWSDYSFGHAGLQIQWSNGQIALLGDPNKRLAVQANDGDRWGTLVFRRPKHPYLIIY